MLKICSKEEFVENRQYDAIFCFGAGKLRRLVAQEFADTVILNRIACFVDNDISKAGTSIKIRNFEYRVYTPDIFRYYRNRKIAVIITCKNITEVLEQLEHDENLQLADFYYIKHFALADMDAEAMKKEVPENLRLSKKPMVPKVIHYCWFGHNPIPDKYKAWMESWHKFCPDYEIKEWNESNYDITKNKYMLQAYEHKKWGFVPDYARLDIIYNYGGLYFDTDIEIVKNFDEMLYQKGFAGFEREKFVNLGSGFGAVPRLPIIKEMMDFYDEQQFVNEDGSLNLIASPSLQTNILLKHGLKLDGEYQIVDDLTIFPEKMFSAKSSNTRITRLKPYTRSIHHYDASWVDEDDAYKKQIMEIERSLELCTFQNEVETKESKDQNIKISVVVIIYNVEHYLDQCIQSIINQSYKNLEVILVDDGSTDSSGIKCDDYAKKDNRIKVIHKKNEGLVSARQAGVKVAEGDYIAFVDGDDWIEPDMYEVLCDLTAAYQTDVVLSGIVRDFPEKSKVDCNLIPNGYYDKRSMEKNVYPKMMFSVKAMNHYVDPSLCNKLFRKEYISKSLLAEDREIFYLGEDAAATYPCLLEVNSIFSTERAFYHHRIIPSIEIEVSSYKRKHVYERLEKFYLYLKDVFGKTVYDKIMQPQLIAYYMMKLNQLTIRHVGVDFVQFYTKAMQRGHILDLLTTLSRIKYGLSMEKIPQDCKLALYGAGAVGKDYIMQLYANDYEIVAWCDKNAKKLKLEGYPVIELDEMQKYMYDIILVAAKREEMYESMKESLLEHGVDAEKILWLCPIER